MKISKLKINLLLIISASILILIVVFSDDNNLNSIIIDYNEEFVINEVNTGTDESTEDNDNSSNAILISKVATDNWIFPVDGNYVITTYYSYSHQAIDIYSYNGYGSSIKAANNGEVITVGKGCYSGDLSCNGRRGNYVVIKHNKDNYYTIYMHLADIYVNEGDIVSGGQVIATMGNTGNVEPVPTSSNPYAGTHLHFCVFIGEPYNGGYAINPFNIY